MVVLRSAAVLVASAPLLVPSPAPAARGLAPAGEEVLVVTGVTLIDGTGAGAREDVTLEVRGGRLVRVVAGELPEVPAGARVLPGAGRFAVPGLFDVHTHLATDPGAPDHAAAVERQLRELLGRGVTDVRDMGGDGRVLAELARRTASGDLPGPDVHFAAILAGPEYFGDRRILAASRGVEPGTAPWAHAVTDETDLAELMAAVRELGARGVKLYADLGPELTGRVARAAREAELGVWAHWVVAPGRTRALDVVRADVEVVSHAFMPMHDATPEQRVSSAAVLEAAGGERLLDEMRARGTILDATLVAASGLRAPPDWVSPAACAADVVRAARAAGVEVATGSDHPGDGELPGIHLEYALLAGDAGLAPGEVLESATRVSARAVGVETSRGTLEVGKHATLLLLDADPRESVRALAEPAFVVKRGVVYAGPALRDPAADATPLESF